MKVFRTLATGLVFGEGPRWHDGKLWFSDMHAHQVKSVDLAGNVQSVVDVPNQPSGLGWSPDGSLLIVSMTDRRLLRYRAGKLDVLADLNSFATFHANELVVDRQGRAYVGNFGFNIYVQPMEPATASLVLVEPNGAARVVARELAFPNGMAITPDGRTLIVAETFAARITSFEINPDGSLTGRRVWASFDEHGMTSEEIPNRVYPDGLCLDAEGAVWVASPSTKEVIRIREGGEITDRLQPSQRPFACMLGGPDRRTLFVMTGKTHDPEKARAMRMAKVEIVEVDVPGAGWP